MRAARELVDRAAHGAREHTYGINTGFGRFVSESIPEEQTRELQLRLLRSHACGVGEPVSRRGRARGDAAARERAGEGLLGRAGRDGRAPARLPERAGSCRTCRAAARSARAATSRRSRTLRCRSSGRARPGSTASACPGARRSRGVGLEPMRARGEGGALARQRHAVHGGASARSGSCAPAGSRDVGRHRVRALARGAAGLAHELPAADPRAAPAARPAGVRGATSCACSRAPRSSSRTAGATRCRTPTRCAARPRCTAPRATCSTTSTTPSSTELNSATDNPLVLVEDDMLVSNGQLPRPAARVRARRAGDGGRRAREHLRAARRAARQPEPVGRAAGVPDGRRRPQLGVHDPPVRGRVARQREQGARATRRASTRSRRAPARRITCRWGTRPG